MCLYLGEELCGGSGDKIEWAWISGGGAQTGLGRISPLALVSVNGISTRLSSASSASTGRGTIRTPYAPASVTHATCDGVV